MKFTLGFSPCPNDTFIFDALVNKKIDTGDFEFDVVLEDVQTLNQWAIDGKLDISKISYGVLPLIVQQYKILHSGGALGKGVGPLLISANPVDINAEGFNINDYTIAIPGEHTTAHLLFSLAFPGAKNKIFKIFHEIEGFLLNSTDQKTLGVIIHENRFTYQQKGLYKLIDLGDFWEKKTGYPIPLGGIAIKKNISPAILTKIDQLIQQSIEYAFSNYPYLPEYVTCHSQEMEENVMRQHIDLYVNNYSVDIGKDGKEAVNEFLHIYEHNNPVSSIDHNVFIQH
ncbi:1,4-dihydroxy-6-naphthoate synthase [Terrimonas sp.]|uniref:1,4-dihydroxy-6-naphthoate synthase n=1 Tax=Terrimonas sp. TaxID=1914338 RepID=UPI000D522338|nr:1,4-dihydroxy-6-naphthoate synthase [Terrimonas sp.]PVD50486.1 1,4-dihydroxy-6-naphthoate synthase [Terrimonas sp.]